MSLESLPKHTPDEIAGILRHIPPAPDYETWVKICASVCSEIGEADGLRVLLDWSPDYGENRTETVIRSFRGSFRSTVATLISIASEHGFNNSEFQKKRFEKYAKSAFPHKSPVLSARKAKQGQYKGKQSRGDSTPKGAQGRAPAAVGLPPVKIGECAICSSARKPETVKPCKLLDALAGIKAGTWKNEVEAVRAGTREKSTLPQICAFGVYHTRRKDENLMSRSGFLVLDYDGKDNPGIDFSALKQRLSRLPFVLAAFTSPSGNGLKVLIRIPNGASDSGALEAAKKILAPLGGNIDENSEARKHFLVSYDADTFLNPAPLGTIPELPNDFDEMPPESLSAIFAETVNRFGFKGKDNYFYDAGKFYKELSKSDASEEFTIRHGLSRKAAQKLLYATRETQTVQDVFPSLTCRKKGIHTLAERKVLILRSPNVIESEEGDFPLIKEALETIFQGDYIQLRRFLAWIQHARKSFLRALESNGAQTTPVPLLMLLGTAGAGKDLLFQTIIRPALGDRQHAGADTFPQEKQWLGAIIGAECVLASEMPKLNGKERDKFKATIKQVLGGSGYNAESKGKDGFTFSGQHFITLLANIDDGGNCASACPAIDEDFKDKFVALSLGNAEKVKALFPGEKANENRKIMRRELPAFLYWLEIYFDYPEDWKDKRFGVSGYCSPEAARALFEVSPAATLREQLLFIAEKYPLEIFDKDFSAAEISAKLQPHFKILSLSALGKALRDLCKREPERFVYNGSQKHPAYKILREPIRAESETTLNEDILKNHSPFEGLSF